MRNDARPMLVPASLVRNRSDPGPGNSVHGEFWFGSLVGAPVQAKERQIIDWKPTLAAASQFGVSGWQADHQCERRGRADSGHLLAMRRAGAWQWNLDGQGLFGARAQDTRQG